MLPLSTDHVAPLLRLRNLYKTREQGDARFELHVPEFSIHAGQFVAIVGESGCGKSTLLDMLAIVLKPSSCDEFSIVAEDGTATDIWGLWSTAMEESLAEIRRRDLGYVLQTGGLLPFLSTAENIHLPLRILGISAIAEEIHRLAARIGIAAVLGKKPQHLSGGQRQRAAILRALVHRPRLILADEPTAAVDKSRAHAIVEDFKALARDHQTAIVMVTHDYDLVRDLADFTYSFEITPESTTSVRSLCRRQ